MKQHSAPSLDAPELRQARLAERLADGAALSATALAAELGVSVDTVRRDLARLEGAGLARRVRGGALPATPAAPLHQRRGEVPADLIRRAVAALAQAPTLILDGGTTLAALARALPPGPGRLVITPSPHIAAITHGRGIATVTIGGPVSASGGIATGSAAEAAFAGHHADMAILGACGLDPAFGLSSDDLAEAQVKRAMAGAAGAVAVLTGAAKIGRRARHRTLRPPEIDLIVTDAAAEATAPFAALGIALPAG